MILCLRACLTHSALIVAAAISLSAQQPELDYLYFKERVQPILAEARAGQERCVSCREANGGCPEPTDSG